MGYTLRDKLADQISYHWWKQDPAGGGTCSCGRPDSITDGYTYHLADVLMATVEAEKRWGATALEAERNLR